MSTALDLTVVEAMEKGWTLRSRTDSQAVMFFRGSGSGDAVVNVIMTVLTFGLWLIPWLFMEIGSTPSQMLIITEIDGKISQKVIKA